MSDLTPRLFTMQDDIPFALLDFRDDHPDEIPEHLRERVTAMRRSPSLGDVVRMIEDLWHAGPDLHPELLLIAAGGAQYIAQRRLYEIGRNGDAEKMYNALLRDAGLPGQWPDVDEDPQRGLASPPVMTGPLPVAPAGAASSD